LSQLKTVHWQLQDRQLFFWLGGVVFAIISKVHSLCCCFLWAL